VDVVGWQVLAEAEEVDPSLPGAGQLHNFRGIHIFIGLGLKETGGNAPLLYI
jgi:hypothetical protein